MALDEDAQVCRRIDLRRRAIQVRARPLQLGAEPLNRAREAFDLVLDHLDVFKVRLLHVVQKRREVRLEQRD